MCSALSSNCDMPVSWNRPLRLPPRFETLLDVGEQNEHR